MTSDEFTKKRYVDFFADIFCEIGDIGTSASLMAESIHEAIETWITYHDDAIYRYELLTHKLSPICTLKHYEQQEQGSVEKNVDSDGYGGRRDRLPRRIDKTTELESE